MFIRLATEKEINSPTERRRVFNSLPEPPAGYANVYKPYGIDGKGFYYEPEDRLTVYINGQRWFQLKEIAD